MGTITRGLANSITTGGKVVSTSLSGNVAASNVNNESLDSVTAFDSSLGDFVETTATDVSAGPTTKGQLFYNTSDGVLKGIRLGVASWASGGNLINATRGGAGIGTRDAAVAAGGILGTVSPAGSGGSRPGHSEEYNGTAWSNLPTIGRSPSASAFILGGCGTATAGIIAGGMPGGEGQVANSDEWDGSSWTAGGAMGDARQSPELSGTSAAAFVTGGRDDPGSVKNTSEIYDGSSWTNSTSMSNARYYHAQGGTTTATWVAGGSPPGETSATEEWNGSSWTSGGALNTATYAAGMGGPQTSAIVAAGGSPYSAVTQLYDGSTWSTSVNVTSARRNVFGSPNVADNSTGMIAGGTPAPANVQSTEEFSGATEAVKTITAS